MYCSKTWAQTKTISSSLKSADMKALRRITGETNNKVTNVAVIKMTGLVDLNKLQGRSRLRSYGHVHRKKMTMRLNQQTRFQSQGKDQQEGQKTPDRQC